MHEIAARSVSVLLGGGLLLVLSAVVAGAEAAPAAGEASPAGSAPSEDGAAPDIDLDLLLKLPDSYIADGDRRGGATRSEWRSRFFEARESIDQRQDELEQLQLKLEGLADDSASWAAGAPGLANPDPQTQTLSYKLRQDLRRARESIEEAERALRDLRVRADLADVPESWRE